MNQKNTSTLDLRLPCKETSLGSHLVFFFVVNKRKFLVDPQQTLLRCVFSLLRLAVFRQTAAHGALRHSYMCSLKQFLAAISIATERKLCFWKRCPQDGCPPAKVEDKRVTAKKSLVFLTRAGRARRAGRQPAEQRAACKPTTRRGSAAPQLPPWNFEQQRVVQ